MRVSVKVTGDAGVRQALNDLKGKSTSSLVTAINRVARDLRSRVLSKTVEIYNISRRDLTPYVTEKRASASNVSASVRLLIRAVPIEMFRPRVRMQKFTFTRNGRKVTRTLPAIFLRRTRGGAEAYVPPAFPLHQRRTGLLGRGDSVRRRIGTDRDRLTRIRYYTFPQQFVDEVLLPDAQDYIGPAVNVELRRALRRTDARGRSRLVRNQ